MAFDVLVPQMGESVLEGTILEWKVKVGDKVLYSKYAGTDIKLGSEDYVLLSEKDILATVV